MKARPTWSVEQQASWRVYNLCRDGERHVWESRRPKWRSDRCIRCRQWYADVSEWAEAARSYVRAVNE